MFKNYLNIAFRNLRRRKFFAVINIIGLTLGLTCAGLVLLYLDYEWGYDRFQTDHERIFRLNHHYRANWYSTLGFKNYQQATPAEQMRYSDYLQGFPEVEKVCRFAIKRNWFAQVDEKQMVEHEVLLTNTGTELLDIFTFDFLDGDAARALERPNTVVMSQSAAQRYFGDVSPLGKMVELDTFLLEITGVYADLPPNSHLLGDWIAQVPRIPHWGAFLYMKLTPAATPDVLASQIIPPNTHYSQSPLFKGVRLQALTDLHLADRTLYEIRQPGNKAYILIFAVIGSLILLITCTNYMNLSVAMYSHRTKEIGIRKVAGADRKQIVFQFLLETILLSLCCLPLAFGLLEGVIPFFNGLMNISLNMATLLQPLNLGIFVGITLMTGLISGSYPAWFLAGKKVAFLFKPQTRTRKDGLGMRRTLVLVQFCLLIGMISATLLIQRQLRYMQEKDLGFEPEGLVYFRGISDPNQYNVLKEELLKQPDILSIGTGPIPGPGQNNITYKGDDSEEVYNDANHHWVDYDYLKVMGFKSEVLDRFQVADGTMPEEIFMVNQTAVHRLGYADPIGRKLYLEPEDEEATPWIIGEVIPDVHYYSLHEKIRPVFFRAFRNPSWIGGIMIRIQTQNLPQTIQAVEDAYYAQVTDIPFRYSLVDAVMTEHYMEEQRIATFCRWLTGIAIFLAVLGLVGLTAYLARVRRKEIGIRKVLGASVSQIVLLLNREIVWVVAGATVIAVPVTWYLLHGWLMNFAYREGISVWVFFGAGLGALTLAVAASSLQAFKAARVNPAESLKDE